MIEVLKFISIVSYWLFSSILSSINAYLLLILVQYSFSLDFFVVIDIIDWLFKVVLIFIKFFIFLPVLIRFYSKVFLFIFLVIL